jgi:hypothetical protein
MRSVLVRKLLLPQGGWLLDNLFASRLGMAGVDMET